MTDDLWFDDPFMDGEDECDCDACIGRNDPDDPGPYSDDFWDDPIYDDPIDDDWS